MSGASCLGAREAVVDLVSVQDRRLGVLLRDREPASLREVDQRCGKRVVRDRSERPQRLANRWRIIGYLAVVLADVGRRRWLFAPLEEDPGEREEAESRDDGAGDVARLLLVGLAIELVAQISPALVGGVRQQRFFGEDRLLESPYGRRGCEVGRRLEHPHLDLGSLRVVVHSQVHVASVQRRHAIERAVHENPKTGPGSRRVNRDVDVVLMRRPGTEELPIQHPDIGADVHGVSDVVAHLVHVMPRDGHAGFAPFHEAGALIGDRHGLAPLRDGEGPDGVER